MSEYIIQKETLDKIAEQSMVLSGKKYGVSPLEIISDITEANGEIAAQRIGLLDVISLMRKKTTLLCDEMIARSISGELYLDTIETVGTYAFGYCSHLTSVNFPAVHTIESDAFTHCENLTSINFPAASVIGNTAFEQCTNLILADFPSVTQFGHGVFEGCTNLKALILRNNIVAAFESKEYYLRLVNTCYIYVPRALIEDYKVAKNWSRYASQFRALEDYTIDGTITGELDKMKV